jgi:hypothetical protein
MPHPYRVLCDVDVSGALSSDLLLYPPEIIYAQTDPVIGHFISSFGPRQRLHHRPEDGKNQLRASLIVFHAHVTTIGAGA